MPLPDTAEVLKDTQASLSVALARLECHRLREEHYKKENVRLRALLREQGINNIDETLASSGQATPELPSSPATKTAVPCVPKLGQEFTELRCSAQEHPVKIHNDNGTKTLAHIIATEDSLDVVQFRATVRPAEYVGVCTLAHPSERVAASLPPVSAKSMSKSSSQPGLFSAIFRRRPTHQDAESSSTSDSPPLASTSATPWESGASGFSEGNDSRRVMEERFATLLSRHTASRGAGGLPGSQEASSAAEAAAFDESTAADAEGTWQLIWKRDGGGGMGAGTLCTMTFDAAVRTRAFLHRQVEAWSSAADDAVLAGFKAAHPSQSQAAGTPGAPPPAAGVRVQEPRHLTPGRYLPPMSCPSALMNELQVQGLMTVVPTRYRQSKATCLYSTAQHGFSLHSLYRRAAGSHPVIIVVQDTHGYVFGCFASDALKVSPRYYGTGETFVFQLLPHTVAYNWKQDSGDANEYFIMAAPDSLGVGGGPHFALWLDGDLLYGSSGVCGTFASPQLSGSNEFKIVGLEVWALG